MVASEAAIYEREGGASPPFIRWRRVDGRMATHICIASMVESSTSSNLGVGNCPLALVQVKENHLQRSYEVKRKVWDATVRAGGW